MSVRDSVLEALQQEQGSYLSGEKLSEELNVSRAAVWKAIKSLREEGYRIDAVTRRRRSAASCRSDTGTMASMSMK